MASVELRRGDTLPAVRLIALAERLRFGRSFQPTMSGARVSSLARQADHDAYAAAVASLSGLGRDALFAAAAQALRARDGFTAAGAA